MNVCNKKLVELIEEYNFPISKVDQDKYEIQSSEIMGGDWGARRDLVLWRRTMWK